MNAWGNERLIRMSQEDTKDEYLGRPSKVLMALFWLKQSRLKSSSYSIIIFCRLLFSKRHFTAFSSGRRQTFCGLTSISSSSSNLSKSYLFVWILCHFFHSVILSLSGLLPRCCPTQTHLEERWLFQHAEEFWEIIADLLVHSSHQANLSHGPSSVCAMTVGFLHLQREYNKHTHIRYGEVRLIPAA